MKTSQSKFLSILLTSMFVISACSPSQQRELNKNTPQNAGVAENEESLPTVVEQKVTLVEDNAEKVLEDKGKTAQYETPQSTIKNGEDIMYVGFTKLKNVKSIYDRSKNELEVSGLAEILNSDKKSVRVSQEFKIKGKYKASRGTINLRPTEDSKETKDFKVRAVVSCFKSDVEEKYDCDRAIIDLFIKHQNNYYTEQLESNSFTKPVVVGEKEKPAAEPKIDLNIIEDKVTVEDKPQLVIDESKEEVDPEALAQVAEGDEDSIAGRYEGKAKLVKLAKLFFSRKEQIRPGNHVDDAVAVADDDDDDDAEDVEDQEAAVVVSRDTRGRIRLNNQAVGSTDSGRLRNASFLKTHIESYNLADKVVIANPSPKNYYGTQEMMEILEAIGEKANTMEKNKIFISRISAKHGGRLPPSKSHQNGMDVDIGYFTNQGQVQFPIVASQGSLKRSDFSVEKTLEVFSFLMTQDVSPVDRLFVDQAIINALCREVKKSKKLSDSERLAYKKLFENMQHVDGHGNHFHLRLRCTPNQPDCRHRIYKKMNNCSVI